MLHARFITLGSLASLAALGLLTNCSPSAGDADDSSVGSGSAPPAVGGGGPTSGGASGNTGGLVGTGGGGPTSGGASGVGGTGSPGTGGTGNPTGGSSNSGSGGSDNPAAGGGENSGTGGSDSVADAGGKMNAALGAMSSEPQDYLRIGDIRILNNNWGSEDLGCFAPTSTMSVFVNQDKSFGWTFARGDCEPGAMPSKSKPDFPQLEFGVHPFGPGSDLATSPDYSSTLLLPKQIKDITSASVVVKSATATMEQTESWDLTFEFWLSEGNPLEAGTKVYAELMTFWGWQPQRWPDSGTMPGPTGPGGGDMVTAGSKSYKLWVQDDNWADGKWRYFQFRDSNGSNNTFDGTLDIKALIDYLVNNRGYSPDLWVTRFEIGSEVDDMTKGSVKIQGVTFEVNQETRSQVFAP